MLLVDTELEKRERSGKPILVSVGVIRRMIALQLLTPIIGRNLVAIAIHTILKAKCAFKEGGAQILQFCKLKTVASIDNNSIFTNKTKIVLNVRRADHNNLTSKI